MNRVLIADDFALLRLGVKETLMRELPGVSCGEAANAQQVLDRVHERDWDLVILDISMPGGSGLEVLRTLKLLRPKLPVLVLSMHSEDQYGKRVLKTGAAGYMSKECAPDELIKAVHRVLAGGRYLSSALAERLALDLEEGARGPLHESLSAREFEVMRLIGAGKSVGEIAELLSLSSKTVSTYRARIFVKMGFRHTADLIRYVVEHRLFP